MGSSTGIIPNDELPTSYYTYTAGTQMTLLLIGNDLVVEWPRLKIEDNRVPGTVYIYKILINTNYWASLGTMMLQSQN